MPYGPTHKEQMYALWAYSQRIKMYALWAYSQRKNICLMGLLAKKKYMPYGPTSKEQICALWAYLQRIKTCLMGLCTRNIYIHYPMSLCA